MVCGILQRTSRVPFLHRWYFSTTDAPGGQSCLRGSQPSSYLRHRETTEKGREAERSLCGEGAPESVLGSGSFPAVPRAMPAAALGTRQRPTRGT